MYKSGLFPASRTTAPSAPPEEANTGRTTGSPLTTAFNTLMAYPLIESLAIQCGVTGVLLSTGDDGSLWLLDSPESVLFETLLEQQELQLGFKFKVSHVSYYNNAFCGCNFIWSQGTFICVKSPERVMVKLGWLREPKNPLWNAVWAAETVRNAAISMSCVPYVGDALQRLSSSPDVARLHSSPSRTLHSVQGYLQRDLAYSLRSDYTGPVTPETHDFYLQRWLSVGALPSSFSLEMGAQFAPVWLETVMHSYVTQNLQ
jgi:hypothetical protein